MSHEVPAAVRAPRSRAFPGLARSNDVNELGSQAVVDSEAKGRIHRGGRQKEVSSRRRDQSRFVLKGRCSCELPRCLREVAEDGNGRGLNLLQVGLREA